MYSGDQRGSRHEAAVIDAVRHGSGMRFFVDEIRCPIQVDDLARGLVELALAPCPAGPMHLAGPEAVSRAGFARLVAAHRGDDPARVETIRLADVDAPRPAELVLDSTLATRCLGWTPRAVTPVLA